MSEWIKKHCDYHRSEPVEAETTRETAKAVYVMLRCPECNRIRGERRKVRGEDV